MSLRQQVIKFETDDYQEHTRRFLVRIEAVKSRLDEKTKEIGGLVDELGALQSQAASEITSLKRARPRRSSTGVDPKRRRSGLTLSETIRHQEGRLPPIAEGTAYPRPTLK